MRLRLGVRCGGRVYDVAVSTDTTADDLCNAVLSHGPEVVDPVAILSSSSRGTAAGFNVLVLLPEEKIIDCLEKQYANFAAACEEDARSLPFRFLVIMQSLHDELRPYEPEGPASHAWPPTVDLHLPGSSQGRAPDRQRDTVLAQELNRCLRRVAELELAMRDAGVGSGLAAGTEPQAAPWASPGSHAPPLVPAPLRAVPSATPAAIKTLLRHTLALRRQLARRRGGGEEEEEEEADDESVEEEQAEQEEEEEEQEQEADTEATPAEDADVPCGAGESEAAGSRSDAAPSGGGGLDGEGGQEGDGTQASDEAPAASTEQGAADASSGPGAAGGGSDEATAVLHAGVHALRKQLGLAVGATWEGVLSHAAERVQELTTSVTELRWELRQRQQAEQGRGADAPAAAASPAQSHYARRITELEQERSKLRDQVAELSEHKRLLRRAARQAQQDNTSLRAELLMLRHRLGSQAGRSRAQSEASDDAVDAAVAAANAARREAE